MLLYNQSSKKRLLKNPLFTGSHVTSLASIEVEASFSLMVSISTCERVSFSSKSKEKRMGTSQFPSSETINVELKRGRKVLGVFICVKLFGYESG